MRGALHSWMIFSAAALSVAACSREDARGARPASPAAEPTTSMAPAASSNDAPAAPPAESGLSVKRGIMMLAQDRSTFRPCDEKNELWVLDQTDGMLANTFADENPSAPAMLYVEARGERAPLAGDEAPEASAYAGVLVLEEVLYAAPQEQVKGCAAPEAGYIVAARGNEPFWAAEVTEGQIVWRQPEAPTEIVLEEPQEQGAEGAVRYRASGGDHEIDVLIDARPCRDSMSGEFFAYSARAVLDGREFNGCARVGK